MWEIVVVVIIVAGVLVLTVRAFCRDVSGRKGRCSCDCSGSGPRPCESRPASRKTTSTTDCHSAK